MKNYIAASAAAALACLYIVVNAEPRQAPAVELAASGAWPAAAVRVARRSQGAWLLRAMTDAAAAATLSSLPSSEPADPLAL